TPRPETPRARRDRATMRTTSGAPRFAAPPSDARGRSRRRRRPRASSLRYPRGIAQYLERAIGNSLPCVLAPCAHVGRQEDLRVRREHPAVRFGVGYVAGVTTLQRAIQKAKHVLVVGGGADVDDDRAVLERLEEARPEEYPRLDRARQGEENDVRGRKDARPLESRGEHRAERQLAYHIARDHRDPGEQG